LGQFFGSVGPYRMLCTAVLPLRYAHLHCDEHAVLAQVSGTLRSGVWGQGKPWPRGGCSQREHTQHSARKNAANWISIFLSGVLTSPPFFA